MYKVNTYLIYGPRHVSIGPHHVHLHNAIYTNIFDLFCIFINCNLMLSTMEITDFVVKCAYRIQCGFIFGICKAILIHFYNYKCKIVVTSAASHLAAAILT